MDTANESNNTPLYLEDLHVGLHFSGGPHLVDEAQITSFATQFDPQPFHLDRELAKDTVFKGLVASGWHTAAITMRLLVTSKPPLAGGIIGVQAEAVWPMPTRPGDVLRVEGEVAEIAPSHSRPDRGIVTMRSETLNQRDEIVQKLVAKLMVFRRR